MSLVHFYRKPALSAAKKNELLSLAHKKVSPDILEIETENCFNVEITAPLIDRELVTLRWLLAETFEPDNFSEASFLTQELPKNTQNVLIEVGPRMSFSTAWSTNAVSVCHACGLTKIRRIERSRRYRLISGNVSKPPFPPLSKGARERTIELSSSLPQPLMINLQSFLDLIHDRMTECQYTETIRTFETGTKPESYYIVPLIEQGKDALRKINTEMGLGLDDWDVEYYYNLFVHDIGRNPTNVECFDLGQSNSEHSRHWFFKGRLFIDGTEMSYPLMDLIKQPLEVNPGNSFIAFKDNSSAIRGFNISTIIPEYSGKSSRFQSATLKIGRAHV
jgi:phosphoribosylformylglycinamidine synthase